MYADGEPASVPRRPPETLREHSAGHPGQNIASPARGQGRVGPRPDVDPAIEVGDAGERTLGDQDTLPLLSEVAGVDPDRLVVAELVTDQPFELARVWREYRVRPEQAPPLANLRQREQAVGVDDQSAFVGP